MVASVRWSWYGRYAVWRLKVRQYFRVERWNDLKVKDCKNYRGISLLSETGQSIWCIILNLGGVRMSVFRQRKL